MSEGQIIRAMADEYERHLRVRGMESWSYQKWDKSMTDPPDARDGEGLVNFFNALGSARNRYRPGDTDRSRNDVLDRMRALRVTRAAETEADRAALRVLDSIEGQEVQERLWKRR